MKGLITTEKTIGQMPSALSQRQMRMNRGYFSRHLMGWTFLFPAVILFAVFSWYPIVNGLLVAFQHYRGNEKPTWAGLDNFRIILSQELFFKMWENTFLFVGLALVIGFIVPVIMAVTINEIRRAQSLFRFLYYIPSILPGVVVTLLWKWLYDPGNGLLNTVLKELHLSPSQWYLNPKLSMLCLVVMATWAGAGGTMLIYLAALQGVNSELYEAAEIDGAGVWNKVRYITIPQIRSVMLVLMLLQIIGTTQVFTEPFIMTGGGPNNATQTVMLTIYKTAFSYFDFGQAAAHSFIMFVVLLLFTALYFRLTKRYRDMIK